MIVGRPWWGGAELDGPHLREEQCVAGAGVQAQDLAQRLEELLDAEAELFLLQPAGGARVQDPRLHDELEEVLQCLGEAGEGP